MLFFNCLGAGIRLWYSASLLHGNLVKSAEFVPVLEQIYTHYLWITLHKDSSNLFDLLTKRQPMDEASFSFFMYRLNMFLKGYPLVAKTAP